MQEYLPLLSILLLGVTIVIFARIPVVEAIFSTPYRLIIALLKAMGILKKYDHWSVVYDSKTKLPIDPAYITVKNPVGVEVASMITDLNGRFALLLPRGLYIITAQKTNYLFPSEALHGAKTDGKYTGLYYGETLDITDSERAVAVAIPMDPVAADWNQEEKKKRNTFFHFWSEGGYKGSELFYCLIGIVLTGWLYRHTPNHFYSLLLVAYVIVLVAIVLWRSFEPARYTHSVIIDKKTKQPLPFARVTVFRAAHNAQILRKVSSFEGQFTALLPSGKYYLTIERRDEHGAYSLVYTSSKFHIRDGYIGKNFTV